MNEREETIDDILDRAEQALRSARNRQPVARIPGDTPSLAEMATTIADQEQRIAALERELGMQGKEARVA